MELNNVKKETFKAMWGQILGEALENPSMLAEAGRRFQQYSLRNQFLLFDQMLKKNVPLQNVATYKAWENMGRQVKRGARALFLCVPAVAKIKNENADSHKLILPENADQFYKYFYYKKGWFLLCDTEGKEILPIPEQRIEFSPVLACQRLNVQLIKFDMGKSSDVFGYAIGRKIAVHPNGHDKEGTFLHELAHIVLGHTVKKEKTDGIQLDQNLEEVEAEASAYLCKVLVGEGYLEESKLYLQDYLSGSKLPEKNAERIFSAVERILAAGKPDTKIAEQKALTA